MPSWISNLNPLQQNKQFKGEHIPREESYFAQLKGFFNLPKEQIMQIAQNNKGEVAVLI